MKKLLIIACLFVVPLFAIQFSLFTGSTFAQIGVVNPPQGTVPTTGGGNPSVLVAKIVKAGLTLLIIIAFIIAIIWIILAGLQFVTAGGDPKAVSTAWSRIYWGIIGLVVVLGAFAIIKMVETFFQVNIISGSFTLPTS